MKKMDEMEKVHALSAIKITFLYSMIFEFGFWIFECIKAKELVTSDSIMFLLIVTQGVVLSITQLVLRNKASNPSGPKPIIFFLALVIIIILLIGFLFQKLGGWNN